MAMFVHLAAESQLTRIRRNGIRRLRLAFRENPAGIFAVPVTRNFYVSHQWLRELKRRNLGPIAGIYFRIPDEELVWIGHYNQSHRWLTAAQAHAAFTEADDPMGWEVIVPRKIDADEIHRTRILPQIIGWRYYPNAKHRRPCACKFCTAGDFGSRKLRARLGSDND